MKKLSNIEAMSILKKYSIPVARQFLAKNQEQAVFYAKKLGYPVVLKISSPDIIHKTDVGGVIVNLKSDDEVRSGFNKIIKSIKKHNPKAKISGIVIQEMVSGHELIVGSKHDSQFGPVLLFGLGGIFVEILHDVTFRLIPIARGDAREMIQEIKGYKILKGARGRKAVNFNVLEDILLKTSKMIAANKRIQELDINPLFANEKHVIATDVRIISR